MPAFTELLQQGGAHAWLFVPTAILLGALHGLEPGHSKTMMAAFIIAIRGTVAQAVMLGLSAALSHTLVVWVVALGGQYLGRGLDADASEPYFQLASAVIVAGVALWMLWRTWRETHVALAHGGAQGHYTHHHAHAGHGHDHHDHDHSHDHDHAQHHPHNHSHAGHRHAAHAGDGLLLAEADAQDAHARAHAADIARRFKGATVTNGQIVAFGLTGGLVPCPAAITVLLICLQLKQLTLGVALVSCFSIGLAVTMVSAGVLAALSLRHVQSRWSGFDAFAARAPYLSGALMLLVAAYMGWSGLPASV